ncbi:unnamed protein product, partial [Mycena citricolor]
FHHPFTSIMSEFDLSDSDWLEVSSIHSSDNDSLSDSSRCSERGGLASLPLSRRSSISLGSSADDQIDAWEGFVEEGSTADSPGPSSETLPVTELIHDDHDPLVTALDQSLVGTLSASRSSSLGASSTVQNSLRDLRLSFPDPLTSSRDELQRSYETVPSPDICITDDVPNSPMTTVLGKDVDFTAAGDARDYHVAPDVQVISLKEYNVVLYGAHDFGTFISWLLSVMGVREGAERSVDSIAFDPSPSVERPSIGILSLHSSFSRSLPLHSLYIPAIFPAQSDEDLLELHSKAVTRWGSLSIPDSHILRLIDAEGAQIFVDTPISRQSVHSASVQRQLEQMVRSPPKKGRKGFEQLKPAHGVTFVALLSLIMGFAVHTAWRTAHPPSPTSVATAVLPVQPTSTSYYLPVDSQPHSSLSRAAAPMITTALVPSTLKEFALAVFNPPIQFASLSSSATSSMPSKSATIRPVASKGAQSTTDVILRPSTSLAKLVNSKSVQTSTPPSSPLLLDAPQVAASLSLRVAGSLSEIATAAMKALEEIVGPEFGEIVLAIDDLMRAIGRQTTAIAQTSRARARMLRHVLSQRNERAKGKARQLSQTLVSTVGIELRARADLARSRAHMIKHNFVESGLWRSYIQAHGMWSDKLHASQPRSERRRGPTFARHQRERR